MGRSWTRQVGAVASAVALLAGCGAGQAGEEDPVGQQEQGLSATFAAVADAHVAAASPTTNYGSAGTLTADLSPQTESLLRFSVAGLGGTVTRATVRLYAQDGSADGPRLFLTAGGWSESTVSWSTRPAAVGTALGDKGAVSGGTWMEYDVTSAVKGNGEVNFLLVATSSDGTDVASRQAATTSQRPQLVVTTEASTPPPTSSCGETFTQEVLSPRGDATIAKDQPTTNFGQLDHLVADFSPLSELWLGFELPARPFADTSHVVKATLRLYATDGSADGPALYDAVPFDESTITWASAYPGPRTRAPLDNKAAIPANAWVEYDVTSWVAPPGGDTSGSVVAFALASGTDDATRFASRDASNGALRPQLVITRGSGCTYRGSGGALTRDRQYGGSGNEEVVDSATDRNGGLVVLGLGRNGYTFGGVTLTGPNELVLARYDATGAHLWTRGYHVSNANAVVYPRALTVTGEGMILVVGSYSGAPDLGLGALPAASDSSGLFVAKFAPDGRPMWNHGFLAWADLPMGRESRTVYGSDVATDANGSLIVVGSLFGTTNLGGGDLHGGVESTEDTPGLLLAKFRWDGAHLWSTAIEPGACLAGIVGNALATDSAGNVLVGGRTCQTAGLGGNNPETPFVMRYASSGARQWARRIDGVFGEVTDVAVGPGDAVHFGGNYRGRLTFAGQQFANVDPDEGYYGRTDLMVGTYRADGSEAWLRDTSGGFGGNRVRKLAVDASGRLAVIGQQAGADLGGGPLATGPFLARYSAAGAHLWSRSFIEGGVPVSVNVQPSGNVLTDFYLYEALRVDGRTFSSRGEGDLLLLQFAP